MQFFFSSLNILFNKKRENFKIAEQCNRILSRSEYKPCFIIPLFSYFSRNNPPPHLQLLGKLARELLCEGNIVIVNNLLHCLQTLFNKKCSQHNFGQLVVIKQTQQEKYALQMAFICPQKDKVNDKYLTYSKSQNCGIFARKVLEKF